MADRGRGILAWFLLCKLTLPMNLPNDSIAFLEVLNTRANVINLSGHIATKDCRPLLDENSRVLHVAVKWIDGNSSILNDEFPNSCDWHWGVAYLKGGVGLVEPSGLIVSRRHT